MDKKIISLTLIVITIFSGCALKETDTPEEQSVKHIVNAPMYLFVGGGKLITNGLLYGVGATAKVVKGTKDIVVEKATQISGEDSNESLKKNSLKEEIKEEGQK